VKEARADLVYSKDSRAGEKAKDCKVRVKTDAPGWPRIDVFE